MKKLETLLNQLIKLGWEPFGEENVKIEKTRNGFRFRSPLIWGFTSYSNKSLREIVSLESGLWRFVCSHLLISEKADIRDYREDSFGFKSKPIDPDGEYRIIRSALVPEEELEKFLIENIKPE